MWESAWVEWEVCWGVGGGEGSCGGRCSEVCWGVGGGKERCAGSGEVWGGVWESAWGEWGSVLACGERNGGGVGNCITGVFHLMYRVHSLENNKISQ